MKSKITTIEHRATLTNHLAKDSSIAVPKEMSDFANARKTKVLYYDIFLIKK